jgi:hypothetical protein
MYKREITSSYYASKLGRNLIPYNRKATLLGGEAFERPCILQIVVTGLKCELKEDQSHAVSDM